MPRLLDLFCGAGGASLGYARAGFDVVGVDIVDQPNYPFEFHRADAMTYPLAGFDVVHASPPCQAYSSMRNMKNAARDWPDLVAAVRDRLWGRYRYVIENVPGSPLVADVMLCGTSFGLGVQTDNGWYQLQRHRVFECSFPLKPPECLPHGPTIGIYGRTASFHRRRDKTSSAFGVAESLRLGRLAMGIDWMDWPELKEAVPPAYTKWIGDQLRKRNW